MSGLDDRHRGGLPEAHDDRRVQANLIRVDLSLREFAEREVNRIRRYRTKGAASVPNSQVAQGHDGAVVPAANNQPPEITAEQIAAMSADEYEKYLKDKGVKTVQR
jgi:hypothetical protein